MPSIGADDGGVIRKASAICHNIRADPQRRPRLQTARDVDAGERERARLKPLTRQRVEEPALERIPVGVRQFGPAVLRLDRTPVLMPHGLLVHRRHVRAFVVREEPLVRAQQRDKLGVLRWGRERGGYEGVGIETSHPQFAHGGPEGLRERGMPGERPEVTAFAREREEETHHQRRTQLLLGRVDAALDEERRAHAERDVERCDEPEVGPVGALEDQPVAERPANGVRRDKHPLRSRGIGRAETFQLVDKRVHVRLLQT